MEFHGGALDADFRRVRGLRSSGRLGVVERITDDQRTDGHEEQKQHRYGVAPGLCTPVDAAHQPAATQISLFRRLPRRPRRAPVGLGRRPEGVDDRPRSSDERAGRPTREGACDVSRGSALGADAREEQDRLRQEAACLADGTRMCRAHDGADARKPPLADQVLPPLRDQLRHVLPKRQAVGELQILDLAAFVGRLDEAEDACPVAAASPEQRLQGVAARYGLTVSASARGGEPSR